jgi:hypothetical protein
MELKCRTSAGSHPPPETKLAMNPMVFTVVQKIIFFVDGNGLAYSELTDNEDLTLVPKRRIREMINIAKPTDIAVAASGRIRKTKIAIGYM